jgi:hypothetical protein
VFVYQLIRAKYPLEESQALYEHFADMLSSRRDFYTDFERLWWRYQPATYRSEPTRSLQPAATVVAPIGGRHYEITAAELLNYYASIADSRPIGTRADVTLIAAAGALGVSVSTIRRREAELIATGQIRRCVTDDRQLSYVMIGAYVCSQPIVMPDQPDCTPVAPPVVADMVAHVCSQLETPLADAENVPIAAICEECAHAELTHSTMRSSAENPTKDTVQSAESAMLSDAPLPSAGELLGDCVHSEPAAQPPSFLFAGDLIPAHCVPATNAPAADPPPMEPVEDLWLGWDGSSRLPLVDLVIRALALVEHGPKGKQKPLVRAIVQAERPRVDDAIIDRTVDDARDILRLRAMPDRVLAKERIKRKRCATTAWSAVGINPITLITSARDGLDILPIDTKPATNKAWALLYRAGRADQVWIDRHGALPSDDTPPTQAHVGTSERKSVLAQHAIIRAQRDLAKPRREHAAEQQSLWMVEESGIERNYPKPALSTTPDDEKDTGGCVLPPPVLAAPQAAFAASADPYPPGFVSGMIARLQARKQRTGIEVAEPFYATASV